MQRETKILVLLIPILVHAMYLTYKINNLVIVDCELDIDRVDAPMVLSIDEHQFIYPKVGTKTLKFQSSQRLELTCPGSKVFIDDSIYYDNLTTATCVSGTTINVNSNEVEWSKIKCSPIASRVAQLSGIKCANNGVEVNIGFEVNDIFLKLILICFDETTQQALYSQATIPASINQRNTNIRKPQWLQTTNIFSIPSPDSYYTCQRSTINLLLGLPTNSTLYIKDDKQHFLSRGHMTAKADTFYSAQQRATYFLLNAAPQWQTSNGGNWASVENSVREYAETNNVNLIVWTGVYGVAQLPHKETKECVQLYLYNKESKKLPVPEVYWKMVYEPQSERGIVILVTNNPYLEKYQTICKDITGTIEWIKLHKNDNKNGFGYACTIDDFRTVINYLPEFNVNGILT